MKPTRQEDVLGCAVACTAFILKIPYSEALMLFNDGKRLFIETTQSFLFKGHTSTHMVISFADITMYG